MPPEDRTFNNVLEHLHSADAGETKAKDITFRGHRAKPSNNVPLSRLTPSRSRRFSTPLGLLGRQPIQCCPQLHLKGHPQMLDTRTPVTNNHPTLTSIFNSIFTA